MSDKRKFSPSLKDAKKNDVGLTFDSMGEFVSHCRKLPNKSRISAPVNNWTDNLGFDAACDVASKGDLSRVEASNKLMSKLENLVSFDTRQLVTVDAMTGGIPNVPAYLSGAPLNMRRRQRVMSQAAPLNIIVDLGSSAGVPATVLERRGACALALVRILSAQRPINLFLGVAFTHMTGKKELDTCALAVRVDSAPLDLARAAFAISGAAFPRRLMYSVALDMLEASNNDSLPFPYFDNDFYRANLHKFWERFVSVNGEETLVIPSMYLDDKFSDPEKWLADMVNKYAVPMA